MPRSADLTAALVVVIGVIALRLWGPEWMDDWRQFFARFAAADPNHSWTADGLIAWMTAQFFSVVLNLVPFLAILAGVGILAGFVQTGGLVSFKVIGPQWKRISPMEGFRRLFSLRSLVEGLKLVLKLAVLGAVGYGLIAGVFQESGRLVGMDPAGLVGWMGQNMWKVALEAGLALLGLAVLDVAYQRFSFERQLRMTRQEIKEEYKRTEGHPTIKRKLRERQRALAQRRMMQEVPKASVVVTNPTHYAVALRYDPSSMDRPQVVAKGADEWALRIREAARIHGVPVVENPPLARRLYQMVNLGEGVPEVLFQAVAEVLAYVYQLKGWRLEGGGTRG